MVVSSFRFMEPEEAHASKIQRYDLLILFLILPRQIKRNVYYSIIANILLSSDLYFTYLLSGLACT